jgi:hypothetical protein
MLLVGFMLGLLVVAVWSIIRFLKALFHPPKKALPDFFVMLFSVVAFVIFPIVLAIIILAGSLFLLPFAT